jgi:hypothetical protein
MRTHPTRRWLVTLALALLFSGMAREGRAGFITYHVLVDTSSITGTQGSLDFQFDASDLTSQTATATLKNFTGGSLIGSPTFHGDASGTLFPGPAILNNTPANLVNELIQDFNYGNSFSFDVTLSGDALQNPNGLPGSTFSLTLFDGRGATGNLLLPIDANTPPALLINVKSDADAAAFGAARPAATGRDASAASVRQPPAATSRARPARSRVVRERHDCDQRSTTEAAMVRGKRDQ